MSDKRPEEEIVFRYSRAKRLERASEEVRRLNDPRFSQKPTLFKTLTATRSQAFLFLAIIMLSATALVTNFLIPAPNETEYKGNRLSFTAFRFEGATYVALRKTAQNRDAYDGSARMSVRFQDKELFLLSKELLFTESKTEEYKFKIDAEGERIEAVIEIEGRYLRLKASTQ